MVYLGDPAIAILERIDRRDGNPWVIAGRKPGNHLTDLQHPWRRIRARADLDDVRIHDLRHSFASGGLLVGEGLPMIGKLLGHTQVPDHRPLCASRQRSRQVRRQPHRKPDRRG